MPDIKIGDWTIPSDSEVAEPREPPELAPDVWTIDAVPSVDSFSALRGFERVQGPAGRQPTIPIDDNKQMQLRILQKEAEIAGMQGRVAQLQAWLSDIEQGKAAGKVPGETNWARTFRMLGAEGPQQPADAEKAFANLPKKDVRHPKRRVVVTPEDQIPGSIPITMNAEELRALTNEEDIEIAKAKFNNAMWFSDYFDISEVEALSEVDALTKEWMDYDKDLLGYDEWINKDPDHLRMDEIIKRGLYSTRVMTELAALANQLKRMNDPEKRLAIEERIKRVEATQPQGEYGGGLLESLAKRSLEGTSAQMGLMGHISGKAIRGAAFGGAGFAAVAAPVGPEAMAAAFSMGAQVGATFESFKAMVELEGGLAYLEYGKFVDPVTGEGISEPIRRTMSDIVGWVNGGLEYLSLQLVVGTLGLGAPAAVATRAAKWTIGRAIAGLTGRFVKSQLVYMGEQVGQEVFQELTTIAGGEISKALSDAYPQFGLEGVHIPRMEWDELAERIGDTVVESALALGPMGIPGNVMSALSGAATIEMQDGKPTIKITIPEYRRQVMSEQIKRTFPRFDDEQVEAALYIADRMAVDAGQTTEEWIGDKLEGIVMGETENGDLKQMAATHVKYARDNNLLSAESESMLDAIEQLSEQDTLIYNRLRGQGEFEGLAEGVQGRMNSNWQEVSEQIARHAELKSLILDIEKKFGITMLDDEGKLFAHPIEKRVKQVAPSERIARVKGKGKQRVYIGFDKQQKTGDIERMQRVEGTLNPADIADKKWKYIVKGDVVKQKGDKVTIKGFKHERARTKEKVTGVAAVPETVQAGGEALAFPSFQRQLAQHFIDRLGDKGEILRSEMVKAAEQAYKELQAGTLKSNFAKIFNKKLANVGPTSKFGVAASVKSAHKTVGAINLATQCPMFNLGSMGCYLDGCYVTGMAGTPQAVPLYQRGFYTGELLQLSEEDVSALNEIGGMRVNGMGDYTDDIVNQMRDVFRHANMVRDKNGDPLQLKIITKQSETLDMIADFQQSADADVQSTANQVIAQLSADPFYLPISEDMKAQGKDMSEADILAAQDELTSYYEGSGRGVRVIETEDGPILMRKWGFSSDQLLEIAENPKYKDLKLILRVVVATPKEIAETALKTPRVLQTWMHAPLKEGRIWSVTENKILTDEAGNFTERISIDRDAAGEWHVLARTPTGALAKGVAYTKVEQYIKDSYSEAQADQIFNTLSGQLEQNAGALCCTSGANENACNDCASICQSGSYMTTDRVAETAKVAKTHRLFQGDPEQYRGSVEWVNDGKALIHATTAADFSTYVHEMAHIWRRQIKGERLMSLEDAYAVEGGEWTDEQEERFATEFEEYLRAGKAPRAGLQELFDKLKQWIEEVYYGMRDKHALKPEVEKVFNSLFAGEDVVNKRMEARRGDIADRAGRQGLVAKMPVEGEVTGLVEDLEEGEEGELNEEAPGTPEARLKDYQEQQRNKGAAAAERRAERKRAQTEEEILKEEKKRVKREGGTELERQFIRWKNWWLGEKEVNRLRALSEAQRLQKRIKETFREIHDRKPKKAEAMEVDAVIHLFIDLKADPGAVQQYWKELNVDQKKLVVMAENLNPKYFDIVRDIEKSYEATGIAAMDAGVINNVLDNYANRIWDFGREGVEGLYKKFGTKTRHARHRVFKTITEGWAKGYKLKVAGATSNLFIHKEEIQRTMADKALHEAMKKTKDSEGNPLITHKWHDYPDYKLIENPNFKDYDFAGVSTVKAVRTVLEKIYNETTTEETVAGGVKIVEASRIRQIKRVVTDTLIRWGLAPAEANMMIETLQRSGSDKEADLVIKTVEKRVGEIEKITEISFEPIIAGDVIQMEDGTILVKRDYFAPANIADGMNNMLGTSRLKGKAFWDALTKFTAITKAMRLLTGFFHHQAFLRSYFLPTAKKKWSEFNIAEAYRSGLKAVQDMTPQIELLVRNGLTLGLSQDWEHYMEGTTGVVGKLLDKWGPSRKAREKLHALYEMQNRWLFEKVGTSFKAKAALIELRSELQKHPTQDVNIIAERVANLINDDFGGLNLARMQRWRPIKGEWNFGRDPTTQHIFRLVALAPDWTESNIRTMYKMITAGTKEERKMYRMFWGRALFKGMALTVLGNFMMASLSTAQQGDEPEDALKEFVDIYEKAWEQGNLRVLTVDVTPLWHMVAPQSQRTKYFSVIGHFRDPIKALANLPRFVRHKSSTTMSHIIELIEGVDWASRPFTGFEEFVQTGRTVGWGGGGATKWEQMPSYIVAQLLGATPIQVQSMMAWTMGEEDAFDAISGSLGFATFTTYEDLDQQPLLEAYEAFAEFWEGGK